METKILAIDMNLLREIGLQIFNTLLLFWILTKLLYNPVTRFMDKRKKGIETEISEATKLKEEAFKIKQEYEEKINCIKKEADEIITTARKTALENESIIISKAKEEAVVIKKRSQADIDLFREQAKDSIKKEIIDVSVLMAKKIIKTQVDESKHLQLIDESIEEIGDVKWLA